METSPTSLLMRTAIETRTADRRRHLRYACTGVIEVYRTDQRVGSAIIENISETGLGFQMDVSVEPGTELSMRNGYVDLQVIVRHTERLPDGYFMGGEFLSEFTWSSDQPWPVVTPDRVP